jgi:endogenous inhibitor of DNA gyrase (YacG/DUF329 family)
MEYDDATGEPINICSICRKEVVGWTDEDFTYIPFVCDECKED